jgi:hypothetical protein
MGYWRRGWLTGQVARSPPLKKWADNRTHDSDLVERNVYGKKRNYKVNTGRNDFMGLNTSHGCWKGAYSAFMLWRAFHKGMKTEAAVGNVPDGKGAAR